MLQQNEKSTQNYFPLFYFSANQNPTYNKQKTKTDFREEDAFSSEDAFHRYDGLTGYPWAELLCALHGWCRGLLLPGGWLSTTLQLPAET